MVSALKVVLLMRASDNVKGETKDFSLFSENSTCRCVLERNEPSVDMNKRWMEFYSDLKILAENI